MPPFDIAPFGLPHCPPGEVWFEETRDVERVLVTFAGSAPRRVGLSYRRKAWPGQRVELLGDMDFARPAAFGWIGIDDWFNTAWQPAKVKVRRLDERTVEITFTGLAGEIDVYPEREQYDVTFRRTLGVRVDAKAAVEAVQVFTRSAPTLSMLRIELDAGRRTPGKTLRLEGYNLCAIGEESLQLSPGKRDLIELTVEHMTPAHRYAYDDGHLTFHLDRDAFTISLTALEAEGPVWYPQAGVYIARADDPTSFADYRKRIAGDKTVAEQVAARPEQSLAGALGGQPRPHPTAFPFGGKHNRQKFWLEANGDLLLPRWTLTCPNGPDTPRFRNDGDARFFFGLERRQIVARFNDPYPVLAYNLHARSGALRVEQQACAVPLAASILAGETAPDAPMAALLRFRFSNDGDAPVTAELPVGYSSKSRRAGNRLHEMLAAKRRHDDYDIPLTPRDPLRAADGRLESALGEEWVLRARYAATMMPRAAGEGVTFLRELAPGESCEIVLRVPFLTPTEAEEAALVALDFEACHREVTEYWREEGRRGASIHTPDPRLDAAYRGHWPAVAIADVAMPDDPALVNTSVGAVTYGNFTNESVMILQELDGRGLKDEVERRLAVWTKYQSTVPLMGNFTDYDGQFYGAGGFEQGRSYCQHHGWALWYLAEHFLFTGDADWFGTVAESVAKGAEWIIRQRDTTRGDLPHSRGWERGFFPAGALEDVDDYFYWLSTNVLTWRGLDAAGRALAAFGHPTAARVRKDADAFRQALRRGFEIARSYSPLIRLRDGRWMPHYPSRLYRRGRDFGWIREVLEGSVYLLISGLYDPLGKEAGWILDDYQDTRYMNPPFGYHIQDPAAEWFDRGGFSIQPNLLEGLRPYLDRDEPELYLWTFFNAWAACYREEIGLLVEHPMPVLGFSNSVPMKTSDEANAMKWLAWLFVYTLDDTLHLGRALPRAWFADQAGMSAERIATRFGQVSVSYRPASSEKLVADVSLNLRETPDRILLRFRHPEKQPIHYVQVNGKPHDRFDPEKGDVELTGMTGDIHVEAEY
jgi:hypothetical protein